MHVSSYEVVVSHGNEGARVRVRVPSSGAVKAAGLALRLVVAAVSVVCVRQISVLQVGVRNERADFE